MRKTDAAPAQPERVAAPASFHAGGVVTDQPDSPHPGVRKADLLDRALPTKRPA